MQGEPVPLFERSVPEWPLRETGRLFPVFGDLIRVSADGHPSIFQAHVRGGLAGPIAGGLIAADLEFLAVGKWLVARSAAGLHVLAGPLIRTDHVSRRLPQVMRPGDVARPRETQQVFMHCSKDVRSRVATMARFGEWLALLVDVGGGTSLHLVDLRGPQPWEAGFRVAHEILLEGGSWHLDRCAASAEHQLVACSPDQILLLEHSTHAAGSGGEIIQKRFQLPSGAGALLPGSVVQIQHGLLALVHGPDLSPRLMYWEWRGGETTLVHRVDAPPDLQWIERYWDRHEASAVAEVGIGLHAFNRLVPKFEDSALPGRSFTAIVERLGSAVIYRRNTVGNMASLRVCCLHGNPDVELAQEPVTGCIQRGALEGRRLWLLTQGAGPCTVRAFEWKASA